MSYMPLRKETDFSVAMQAVHDRLTGFSGEDERLGTLLALSAGRVMLNAVRRGANVLNTATDVQLAHIADWLKAATVNDDPWLRRVDEHGRPKKLMKFSGIDDIVKEADKAMLKAASRYGNVALVDGDEAEFWELDEGYRIVQLLTPAALDRESAEMQHCIGNGGYDARLRHPSYLYLSLRDGSGKAHATLEVHGYNVLQMQGKQNELPVKKYLDKLVSFIQECKLNVCIDISYTGSVMAADGVIHDIGALPDGLTVGGDLDLNCARITALPQDMSVGGNLTMVCSAIRELPENLYVGGNLVIDDTHITFLPAGLHVGGDLELGETSIAGLPDGLTIGGSLDLDGWITSELPQGLTVGGNLYLKSTGIKALPNDLTVGGTIYLDHLAVTIPDSIADDLPIHVGALAMGRETISAAEFRQRNMAIVDSKKPSI